MVYRISKLKMVLAAAVFAAAVQGCINGPETAGNEVDSCDGDCIQPPLRQTELLAHLKTHQERILAREDYRNNVPPAVTEIIYGPLPDGPMRSGPDVVDGSDNLFDGEISWHHIGFDDVITDDVDHDSIRGREVSGAHCFFAQKPNRHTALFALLVVHHPDRGDILYLGGPDQHITRLDTVALTDHHPSRIRVHTDHIHCAFRDDQEITGALIVPFEFIDVGAPSNGPHYAVFNVTTGGEKYATGKYTRVKTATGLYGTETVEEDVPIQKYPIPRAEFIDSFTSLYDALGAAEENIPSGRFRLRPEFIYPVMPWQSYLGGEHEEFCPANGRCETPPEYLDTDVLPPIKVPDDD